MKAVVYLGKKRVTEPVEMRKAIARVKYLRKLGRRNVGIKVVRQ